VFQHELVDSRLRDTRLPASFADGDDVRRRACEVENLIAYKIIRQDDIGSFEQVSSAQR
jgi:hypothetical protein